MSVYDAAAPSFEGHRALPDDVPEAIRAAVLEAVETASPRLLDLGAGTGESSPANRAGSRVVETWSTRHSL